MIEWLAITGWLDSLMIERLTITGWLAMAGLPDGPSGLHLVVFYQILHVEIFVAAQHTPATNIIHNNYALLYIFYKTVSVQL